MRIEQTPAISRADRVPVGRSGTMRDPGRAPIDVLIDNLSETGALLKTAGILPVGTLVSIGIPGIGMQFARITRAIEGAMAAEFMVPLDPKAVVRARSAETLVSVAFPQIERPIAARDDGAAHAGSDGPSERQAIPAEGRIPSSAEIGAIADRFRAVASADPALAKLLRGQSGARSSGSALGTWLLVACVLAAGLICLLL